MSEAEVKELTGGDPITARRMRQDYWTFLPTHKLWMSTKHLPNVRGTDDGIWRRIRAIPFAASFLGREDRKLGEKLRAEAQGILAKLVRGCLAWQERGLQMPPKVADLTERYRAAQDPIGPFLADCFEIDPAVGALGAESLAKSVHSTWRVPQSLMWNAYTFWSQATGSSAYKSARSLHAKLREYFAEFVSNGRHYLGLRRHLRVDWDAVDRSVRRDA